MTTSSSSFEELFLRDRHIHYFASAIHQIPAPYVKLDSNRLTLVHFATHALDLLGVWDAPDVLKKYRLDPKSIVEWIYSLQVLSGEDGDGVGGFQGAGYVGPMAGSGNGVSEYHQGHIAMTYTALGTLRVLGDDLSRVNKRAIMDNMKILQRPEDGSFRCTSTPSEHDMRFLYCACAISYMLQDWSGMNIDLAVQYIKSCRAYDGAISLIPGQEGHGGSTFCGIAALRLMGKLETVLNEQGWYDELIQWCVHRQIGGMQGRPNKAEDTCYSYWIGGTLRLLGNSEDRLLDQSALRDYVLRCQSIHMGGFGKVVGAFPDLLHSFYSLAWLSLSNANQSNDSDRIPIHALNCTLGIRQSRAALFEGPPLP